MRAVGVEWGLLRLEESCVLSYCMGVEVVSECRFY